LGGRYDWFRTDRLSVGDKVLQVFPVWETADNWVSGYIAGLLDGEGSISVEAKHRTRQVSFTQKEGLVMSLVEEYLSKNGISYCKNMRKDGVSQLLIRRDAPKLLGITQPKRLEEKGRILIEKRLHKPTTVRIEAIEPWKECDVIALETNAKTFLTEGIATHNCYVLFHDHSQAFHRVNLLTPPRSRISVSRPIYCRVSRRLVVNAGGFVGYRGYIQRKGYTPMDLGTPRIRMEIKETSKGSVGYHKDLHISA